MPQSQFSYSDLLIPDDGNAQKSCPFQELAKKKSKQVGFDIDLNKDWALYIPTHLENLFRTDQPFVYFYKGLPQGIFFAKNPQSYQLNKASILNNQN